MAQSQAVAEGAQGPQWRQQQQGGFGQTITGIIRMAIFLVFCVQVFLS